MVKNHTVSVNVILDADCNRLLDASKKKSKRTKRQEAGLRLKDHLLRFGEAWQPVAVDQDTPT